MQLHSSTIKTSCHSRKRNYTRNNEIKITVTSKTDPASQTKTESNKIKNRTNNAGGKRPNPVTPQKPQIHPQNRVNITQHANHSLVTHFPPSLFHKNILKIRLPNNYSLHFRRQALNVTCRRCPVSKILIASFLVVHHSLHSHQTQLLPQLQRLTQSNQTPLMNNPHTLTKRLGLLNIMRSKKNRSAIKIQTTYQLPQTTTSLRIQPNRWLIKKQHLRLMHQRTNNRHALLHPPRKLINNPISLLSKPHIIKQLINSALALRPPQMTQTSTKLHVLPHSQITIQTQMLLHHTNHLLHLIRLLHHIKTAHPRVTRSRLGQSGQHTNSSSLPCPIRPQETKHFTRMHSKI